MEKKAILAIIILWAVIGTVIAYAIPLLNIGTIGTVKTPATLQSDIDPIEWGDLAQGEQISKTVTLTNNGQTATAELSMQASPSIGTVSWDADGKTIAAGGSLPVVFTLAVSNDAAPGSFNFDITIIG